jgi:putative PIG3 family NAD(P)H quinone oxidoreductase
MTTAKAVKIRGAGGVDVLTIDQLEVRDPGPGEVLVEIAAAGLNRADVLQRKGFYPAPKGTVPDVPGLEYAGTIAAVGEGAGLSIGDRVMGIVAGGAMATHVVVHAREAIAVPEGMTFEDAAAVPEVFLTAYDALFDRGGMALGDTVIVHSIGSGVGTAALQLCNAAGARVIGTTRTESKLARCAELGIVDGVHVTDGSFRKQVRVLTGGRGADVILDTVGAAYLADNLASLATLGRLVIIGLLGGVSGDIPLGLLLAKRASVIGSVLRARPLEEKIALAQRFTANVVPQLGSGALKPVVDAVMPMTEVAAAHERMESNETFGKIVLTW